MGSGFRFRLRQPRPKRNDQPRTPSSHGAPADLPAQTPGAAIRASRKLLSLSHRCPIVSKARSQGAEGPNRHLESGLSRARKQMPSQGFPREGFGGRRSRQKVRLRQKQYVLQNGGRRSTDRRSDSCCLPAVTHQRRWLDDVDGPGLRGRTSNACCTGLGSSDEANSGEQTNHYTHRYPPRSDGTVPQGDRGVSRKLLRRR
jgi:hypothetical protein